MTENKIKNQVFLFVTYSLYLSSRWFIEWNCRIQFSTYEKVTHALKP